MQRESSEDVGATNPTILPGHTKVRFQRNIQLQNTDRYLVYLAGVSRDEEGTFGSSGFP